MWCVKASLCRALPQLTRAGGVVNFSAVGKCKTLVLVWMKGETVAAGDLLAEVQAPVLVQSDGLAQENAFLLP